MEYYIWKDGRSRTRPRIEPRHAIEQPQDDIPEGRVDETESVGSLDGVAYPLDLGVPTQSAWLSVDERVAH